MAIIEQVFTDILGNDIFLSEIMDEIKEWVVNSQYAGLTNVDDWYEGGMNYFLLYISGLFKFDLELYGDDLIKLAFPNTSSGDFLDRIYARNGIFRKEGEPASTMARFELTNELDFDAVIEEGTGAWTDEPIDFHLVDNVSIPKGESVAYGKVECNEPGTIGNVLAETIVNMDELSFGVSITNEYPVTNGIDRESDEDFKERARDYAMNGVSVGSDLWIEKIAKTLVDDALCYDLDAYTKLLVYKPTLGVTRKQLDELFERKEYRTRSNIIIQEAEPVAVIDSSKSIELIIKNDYAPEPIVKLVKSNIKNYVDKKIRLGELFREICIESNCRAVEGVIYARLSGFVDVDLTNNQYAVIQDELNVTYVVEG